MGLFPGNGIENCHECWLEAIETSPLRKRLIRTEEEQIEKWDRVAG